jgi:hypothetical protein
VSSFTPVASLAGGILIGASASALLLLNGRVAGISGIFSGALVPKRGDLSWRVLFLAGLFAGGWLVARWSPVAIEAPRQPLLLTVLAGLLVGFGTRLGGGCTSGHGVCGVSQMSPRSLYATATFMASGILAAVFFHHVLWLPQ